MTDPLTAELGAAGAVLLAAAYVVLLEVGTRSGIPALRWAAALPVVLAAALILHGVFADPWPVLVVKAFAVLVIVQGRRWVALDRALHRRPPEPWTEDKL